MEIREWEVNLIIIEEIDRNREEVRIYVRIIFSSIFIRFSILMIASLYLFNIYINYSLIRQRNVKDTLKIRKMWKGIVAF